MVTETALTPAEVISAWRTYRPKSAGPRKVYTVRQWNAIQNPYVPPTCLSETTASLRARAHKRAEVEWQGGHVFTMPGVASLSDEYPSYTVDITPGARPTCSCHRHQGGDLRAYRVCSHIVAAWIEAEDKGIDYRRKPPETSPVVVPNDLEAWKVSEAVAAADMADPEISPEAQALVAALQETDEPPSDIEPYTPQEWAELRPPVLGAATPPWLSSITLPPWATTLRPWQVDAVDQIMAQYRAGKKFVLLEAPTGAGKAQPLTEPVLTMYGFKPMGDIRIGDYLPDQRGGVQRVVGVYPQGLKPVVKVEFNDGTSVRCCEDHLWRVRRYDCAKWKTVATKDLKLSRKRLIYHVPVTDPIEFSAKALPMNPYLLGLLLGNGCMKFAGLSFSTGDEFLAEQVRSMLPVGVFLDHRKGPDYAVTIRERGNKPNPVTATLRAMGLQGCGSSTKFVPWDYLVSSTEQRKWLLRGILDTDGHPARNGGIDYVSASEKLCSDVEELVRGLGGIARRGKVKVVKGVEYYRSYLKLPANIEPFYLPRKLAKWKPPTLYPCAKMISSITPDGFEECQCIAVSSEDRTYLTTAYTVTHNTLIGEVVRQLIGLEVGDKPGARGCYICTTKSLQDQFLHDFPDARVIKGKSNYPTANFPHAFNPSGQDTNGRYDWRLAKEHVSCGECTWSKGKGCDWCSRGSDGDQTFRAKLRCPYQMAREASRWAELAVLNTAYFIGMANSGFPRDDEAGGGFAGRPVAILDEFDLVEGVLMSQVEIVMGKRLMERLRIPFPEYKDAKSLGGRAAQECWAPWIEEVAIPAILLEVDRIAEATKTGGMDRKEALKRIRPLGTLRGGLKAARSDMLDDDGAAWIYDGYKEGKVIFKPVKVSRFGDAMLWAHAHFFLCMSATLLDPKAYARDIGIPLEEMAVVKIPSSFPPQQRPIILLNTADNRKANQEKAWPKIAAKVVELLERHAEDRVLVHTVSYPFTSYLMDAVRDAGVTDWRKVLSYDSASEREKRLEIYKATPASVMLAPSFDRGIDLPGDLCRVQIIAKVPYPSLGDKQVSARLYSSGGQTWFTMETIRTLCQMAGRGMRKPDDWCWTYVLDEQISKLLGQHRHLFPREFLDAVMQAGYKGMTPREVERREIQRFR